MNVDLELLTNQDIYTRVMREEIPSANHSVVIATALVKQTNIELDTGEVAPFLRLVDSLAPHGVRFHLLFSGTPSRPFIETLLQYPHLLQPGSNLELRICVRNHMKAVLVDEDRLYLGSANLTGAGLGRKSNTKRNFEFGVFTTDRRVIEQVSNLVHEIWTLEHCGNCKTKRLCQTHNSRFAAALGC